MWFWFVVLIMTIFVIYTYKFFIFIGLFAYIAMVLLIGYYLADVLDEDEREDK